MNALELSHVTKQFPDFLLDDINLVLPSGCIMGLIGENGAGKSTLIRLLYGGLRPDRGRISLLGADSAKALQDVKEDISIVLDEGCFPLLLSARQMGSVLSKLYRRWDEAAFRGYLEQFSLPENKPFKDFSRGMRMKLSIAAALSHQARLLILDEPTSGLDPIVRDEILDLFFDFACDENHSVLISSHIVSDLEKLCDYVAFLHKGQLLLCEEKDRLLDRYRIFRGTNEQLSRLSPEAVVSTREGTYGTEALIIRDFPGADGLPLDRATLEEIIIFRAKGGRVL